MFELIVHILVAKDESGDGDGAFYIPGGEIVQKKLLNETLDFAESVGDLLRGALK